MEIRVKVSVIIPTYNRAELVCETIDSVLQQSFRDYEIIVVDDGSTDNTEAALKPYLDKITYIRQTNAGVNAARNTALQYATGEYIALLDSDDLWLDFKLELEVELLDAHPEAGFVFEDFYVYKPGGRRIPNGVRRWYNEQRPWQEFFAAPSDYTSSLVQSVDEFEADSIPVYQGSVYFKSVFGPAVLPSASLYRRSIAGELQFNENDSTCGDWEFFARLSNMAPVLFVDAETTLNRSHEDAVRLTRLDLKVQTGRMIALIERIWKQDSAFYTKHDKEIDQKQLELYLELIKMQLFESDSKTVRETIAKASAISLAKSNRKLKLFKFIAYIPGSLYLLILIRKIKRLFSTIRHFGLRTAFKEAIKYFKWRFHRSRENAFDKKHGIETSKAENAYLKKMDSENTEFAIPYEPIQEDVFNRMAKFLDINIQEYTFIDLGSGKGRSLLYAASYPFKKLIGVEFSQDLHDIACKNIETYQQTRADKTRFELHCMDAEQYKLPQDNLLLFMYNPFNGPVMQSVIDKIDEFLTEYPYDIKILYRNPQCAEMFEQVDKLELVESNPSFNVYRRK